MKVAIIGSGAACFGALSSLDKANNKNIEITIFDSGKINNQLDFNFKESKSIDTIFKIYNEMKKKNRFSFPSPKYIDNSIDEKYNVGRKKTLWKSNLYGGLTNFWGGGMFPFSENDLKNWKLNYTDLLPYYKIISKNVGISGDVTDFQDQIDNSFINHPGIKAASVFDKLNENLKIKQNYNKFFYYGKTWLALETRDSKKNTCKYHGEEAWLPDNSLWNAKQGIDQFFKSGLIKNFVSNKVIKFKDNYIFTHCHTSKKEKMYGEFDKIYLAAGCLGTSEIIMRSLSINNMVMQDNLTISFPILFYGKNDNFNAERYASLSNMTIFFQDRCKPSSMFMLSLYPFFDHLIRYYFNKVFWRILSWISSLLRKRLIIGRMCLSNEFNNKYNLSLVNDELKIKKLNSKKNKTINSVLSYFSKQLSKTYFYVPSYLYFKSSSSAHYGSTLCSLSNFKDIDIDGKILDNVYAIDSSIFPEMPSTSPTFTIMANACRIVTNSLKNHD